MWRSMIGSGIGKSADRPAFRKQCFRRQRRGFERLEPRWAMTWLGVPPTSILPPSGATAVTLDADHDAAGAASVASTEVDYYSFVAPVAGSYTISATTPVFSNLDTVLGVFSAAGQRLAYNDDISFFNTDSRLTMNLSAGRQYFVGVTNYSSSQQGNYSWAIDGPDGPATPTIDLSGAALSSSNASDWGRTITVQAEVQNTGTVESGTFLVRWYLARDPEAATGRVSLPLATEDRSSVRVQNVGAGSSVTIDVTLKLPSKAPSGWSGSNFFLVMGTDVSGEVDETNENNNLGQVGAGFDSDAITVGTASAPPTGSFSIRLDTTGLTSSQHAIFTRAADRWEEVVVGDLPNATYRGQTVDDLLINASSRYIDGVNGILGQAGPDAFRSSSRLPYHGVMQFDSADLASMERSGLLYGVVLHEIGHILGIGTIWESRGLLSGAGGSNPIFTGSRATAAYNDMFDTSARGVPVESGGGAGTADAHWRESILRTELMTGWAGPGNNLPLSRITAASLADIGYSVNMAAADSFTPSSSSRSAARAASGGSTSIVAAFAGVVPGIGTADDWQVRLPAMRIGFEGASIEIAQPVVSLPDRRPIDPLTPHQVDLWIDNYADGEEDVAVDFEVAAENLESRLTLSI